MTLPPWGRAWLFGAFAGFALVLSVMRVSLAFPFVLLILVAVVIRTPERSALGGGALIPTGLWFLYELRAAVERCAEMTAVRRGRVRSMG